MECLWVGAKFISCIASVVAIDKYSALYCSHTLIQGSRWVHQWHINWRSPVRWTPHIMVWNGSNHLWRNHYPWFTTCENKTNKQSKTDVDGPWIMVNIEKEPSSSLTSSLSLWKLSPVIVLRHVKLIRSPQGDTDDLSIDAHYNIRQGDSSKFDQFS